MTLKKNLAFISVFLLIATSGIPFFQGQMGFIAIGLMCSLTSFLLYTDRKVDKRFLLFMTVVLLVQIFQGASGGQYFWSTYFGLMLRFFWGYMVIRTTKMDFLKLYVKQLYFFSYISIFFYLAMVLVPNSETIFGKLSAPFAFFPFSSTLENSDQTFHIIIYNFHGYRYLYQSNESLQMIRNCGPFWEPGAFVGFLIMSLFFLYISEGTIKNKKGLIFIIAMATTYSTTGYLALMLSLFVLLKAEFNKYKVVIIPLLAAISMYAFFNLSFLNSKIKDQSAKDSDKSRFGSAARDLEFFFDSPFFGQGRNAESAYGQATSGDATTNNGLTSTLAGMGIVYMAAFSWMIIYSLKRLSKFYQRRSVVPLYFIFLLISFSETYYTIPFFMSLAFLYVITDYKIGATVKKGFKIAPVKVSYS
ncbi:O-antigen ligase family protein [Mucilaginibacter roseus]|uniref:O-antigen ligase family protein n=1 Tax=Mucilaginibacter roseus TaxID=1528868 RepID=A0ABS8U0A0_9SPHI|nr:O-antigen ligase family protein [Mucilaginibacter roseus]MCD8740539.1 O-antigen ligase family protein [Mucilaginibacter roseus]